MTTRQGTRCTIRSEPGMRLLLRVVFGQCPASWPESDYPDWWTSGRVKGPSPAVGYDGRPRQAADTAELDEVAAIGGGSE